jgi:hypothetical protein
MNKLDNEDWINKQTTVNFRGDLRMSQPWRSYRDDDVFTIIRKTKQGLFILRHSNGKEHPLRKSAINYFQTKQQPKRDCNE